MTESEKQRIMSKILVLEELIKVNDQLREILEARIVLTDKQINLLKDKKELTAQLNNLA